MAKQSSTPEKVIDPHRAEAEGLINEFGEGGIVISQTPLAPSAPPSGGGQPAVAAEPGTGPAAQAAGSEPVIDADGGVHVNPHAPATAPPATPAETVAEPAPADPAPAEPGTEPTPPAEPGTEPPAEPTTPLEPDPNSGAFTELGEPADPAPADPALPVIDYSALSERIGYEVENLEDVEALVSQLDKPIDPLKDVSPFMQQAIEFERNGGDAKQFMSALAIPIDTLSDRGALFQKYLADHPDLKDNPEYAQQKFNREYDTKYGILEDEKLDVDFTEDGDYNQYLQDRKFAKQEFEHESKTAKTELKAAQDKIMTEAPTMSQANADKAQRQHDNYTAASDEFVKSFDGIQIPIDVEGKTVYNVSLNEDSRPLFHSWVKDVPAFLEHIGIPSDGSDVDVEKLNSHMAMEAILSTTGKEGFGTVFASRMTERVNAKTLETELIHPADPNTTPGVTPTPQVNELEETLEGFTELVAKSKPA